MTLALEKAVGSLRSTILRPCPLPQLTTSDYDKAKGDG